jgi:PTH1 family peptidyl-tRNA hydrolase
MALDRLAPRLKGKLIDESVHDAACARTANGKLRILKPLSYMNNSGVPLARIARRNAVAPNEILVVFDDLDLPLGAIRVRRGGGGSGGHKGVESIMEELGSPDFARMRIGIGRAENGPQADYVLSKFDDDEKEVLSAVLDKAAEIMVFILHRGVEEAMNKFNRRRCLIEKVRDGGDSRREGPEG